MEELSSRIEQSEGRQKSSRQDRSRDYVEIRRYVYMYHIYALGGIS